MDYTGKNRTLRVISNKSGRVTFKIPADGDKEDLVSLDKSQTEALRDQLNEHLAGDGKRRAAFVEKLAALQTEVANSHDEDLQMAHDDIGEILSNLSD